VDCEQAAAAQAGGNGAAAAPDIPPRFAIDGIDELIMGFAGRAASRGPWRYPPGVFGFHASDGTGATAHWRVVSEPGGGAVSREDGPADCAVTGAAAELYLTLWNRHPGDGLEVSGDRRLLAAFGGAARVTWG
jgi:hypothetical protein